LRYLITGGAGFIGSYLVESLVARGEQVSVLDDLSTGRLSNLEGCLRRIDFHRGSALDSGLVDALVRDSDVVVHLAAAVGVRLVLERPVDSLLRNIGGAETVLAAADRYGRKVMVASSSEIYGKNLRGPFREEDDRVLGSNQVSRWAYSTSKGVAEALAFAYGKERGLPAIVVRLFNTVGARQSGAHGMVLPSFVAQALAGAPLTVFGDGRQTRCFCHVGDVVRALMALLGEPRAEGDVFNIGSSEEVTIRDVAEKVVRITGSRSPITYIPYDEAYELGFEDMPRRVPDTAKIRSLVGWRPETPLDVMIGEVAAALRQEQGVSPSGPVGRVLSGTEG
jgi:UDP-glucose 4-epimerase